MADDECPHGLDPSWCSLCKQQAAGEPPAGVRRRAAPARVRRDTGSSTRPPRSPAPRATRTPAAPLSPSDGLVRLRKNLFHATALGAWEEITAGGLRPAAALAEESGRGALTRIREDRLEVTGPAGGPAVLRDQRALIQNKIEDHLDGIVLADWLRLMNERVFFFARQDELNTFLAKYKSRAGQDLLVFDTARFLRAAPGRVEVTTVPPSVTPIGRCRCRGRETFVPIDRFRDDATDISEVTVVGGLEDVESLVVRVIRHYPNRTPEILVG